MTQLVDTSPRIQRKTEEDEDDQDWEDIEEDNPIQDLKDEIQLSLTNNEDPFPVESGENLAPAGSLVNLPAKLAQVRHLMNFTMYRLLIK